MSKCQTCPYSFGGNYDPLSDWCDECTHDPDTGWGGFTDHRVGQHFNNEAERQAYYDKMYSHEEEIKHIKQYVRPKPNGNITSSFAKVSKYLYPT